MMYKIGRDGSLDHKKKLMKKEQEPKMDVQSFLLALRLKPLPD